MRAPAALLLAALGAAPAAPDDEDLRRVVEDMAHPLESPRTLYRWQSREAGKNLLKAGVFTKRLHDHLMGMDASGQSAGPGLYVAENPHSSSSSALKSESIIEVKLARGTKILDLTDPGIKQELVKRGVGRYYFEHVNPRVAIRFYEDWWVLKGREGVSFAPFTGEGLGIDDFVSIYEKITSPEARKTYTHAIKNELARRMEANASLLAGSDTPGLLGGKAKGRDFARHLEHGTLANFLREAPESLELLRDILIDNLDDILGTGLSGSGLEAAASLLAEGRASLGIDPSQAQIERFMGFLRPEHRTHLLRTALATPDASRLTPLLFDAIITGPSYPGRVDGLEKFIATHKGELRRLGLSPRKMRTALRFNRPGADSHRTSKAATCLRRILPFLGARALGPHRP